MKFSDANASEAHRDKSQLTQNHNSRAARQGCVSDVVVPIRSLGERHRELIQTHLLSLEPTDRYLRFGFNASDTHISSYVRGLDMSQDELFGIFNRKLELIALAHLAFPKHMSERASTEFGVSVRKSARGRGYGSRLFERACVHSRNEGCREITIHALSENSAMLRIARSAGAAIVRDGPDSEAHLRLPPATLDSRFTEIVQEHWAMADYRYKEHGKHLRDLLNQVQVPKLETSSQTLKSSWVENQSDP